MLHAIFILGKMMTRIKAVFEDAGAVVGDTKENDAGVDIEQTAKAGAKIACRGD